MKFHGSNYPPCAQQLSNNSLNCAHRSRKKLGKLPCEVIGRKHGFRAIAAREGGRATKRLTSSPVLPNIAAVPSPVNDARVATVLPDSPDDAGSLI